MPSACTSPENSARRESKSTPPILARRSRERNDQCLAGNAPRRWADRRLLSYGRGAALVTQGTRETGSTMGI